MPDLLTHILVAWTICTLLGFKWKQFNGPNTALVMVGSVIPDFYKIIILLHYFQINLRDVIAPLHLPIGSLVMAAIISLFFQDKKNAFLFLIFGTAIHFILDLLLINLLGGMFLLYPLSWEQWSLNLISNKDYYVTIIAFIVALIVYLITQNRKKNHDDLYMFFRANIT